MKNIDPDLIRQAAQIMKQGGVVLFPTTCLYGLGADALNEKAVSRVFDIKKRPENNPILVLIGEMEELSGLVKTVPPQAETIMKGIWPGRVTIIFEAKPGLPENLTAGGGKIGVRMCKHPVARALVHAFNGPVTGTSANLSGKPGCSDISNLDSEIGKGVDMILDSGPLLGGKGSTVVDVTRGVIPVVLREGAAGAREIWNLF